MSEQKEYNTLTSALVDVVASHRRLLNQLEEEREEEIHMRFALRKKQWDALEGERDAERAKREKTKAGASGSTLIQRIRFWREERKAVAELRREKLAELEDLRRQERVQEREVWAKRAASSPEDKEKSQ